MKPISSSRLSRDVLRASWIHWLNMSAPKAGPAWLQPAWTAAFSVLLAFLITLLGFVTSAQSTSKWLSLHAWIATFRINVVITLCIGFTIHALFALAQAVFGASRLVALRGWRRRLFFTGTPVLGTAIGWPLGALLYFGDATVLHDLSGAQVMAIVVMTALMCAVITFWFALRNRHILAEMRAHDAQLRLLQGQMEPHFLFNTLANVISLIDADAPQAKRVLEAFTDYLRASLGSLRRADSTLGVELELAGRYLALMQARMGERLRVELDVPEALRGARLPPLLLQPLVENAIKHGLEPQVDGGTVRVRARTAHQGGIALLELLVEDDGIGLEAAAARRRRPGARATEGNGIALANLRERLQTQFGDLGSFEIAPAGPQGGTLARMALPLTSASAESSPANARRA